MDYTEFLNAVCDYINETATDVKVGVHTAIKNNGVKLMGLTFNREGYNASPTIYMENYYTEYMNGSDISEIGDRLLALYYENDLAVNCDMSFFDDFDHIKDRLYIKLINREKNKDFLKEAPFEEFLDLAIVPYVRIYDKKIGNGLIMVRNEHLKLWGADAGTVINIARKNTHDHDDFCISHIADVLRGLGAGMALPEADDTEVPMYVVTNRRMTNGAAVITMKDKLREYAGIMGGDYMIIPSSVNEVILIKQGSCVCDRLDDMIREVNATQLGPDDVLADHAYRYSLKDEVLIF
ncbi:MAG: DUF5688 family protein [Lachnospiraceae bacterium]|nr:DUF5688 family protein [Lachnospiraceae bacterium]